MNSERTPETDMQAQHLNLLRVNLARSTYPGYPEHHKRLVAPNLGQLVTGELVVPDGSWTVNIHPNRREADTVPNLDEQASLCAQGLELDSVGRPLHPWFRQMVADPSIGVVTGKGFYWSWGPNRTVDPIAFQGDDVWLIKRGDTGSWAFPGGFQNPSEPPVVGAAREFKEETSLTIPDIGQACLVYSGVLADIRVTANAWPETIAYRFELDPTIELEAQARDDAVDVKRFPIEQVLEEDVLFGSHRLLLEAALLQRQ